MSEKHSVVYLPGDRIGPEVGHAAREIVAAADVDIDWTEADIGLGAFERCGNALPQEVRVPLGRRRRRREDS